MSTYTFNTTAATTTLLGLALGVSPQLWPPPYRIIHDYTENVTASKPTYFSSCRHVFPGLFVRGPLLTRLPRHQRDILGMPSKQGSEEQGMATSHPTTPPQ